MDRIDDPHALAAGAGVSLWPLHAETDNDYPHCSAILLIVLFGNLSARIDMNFHRTGLTSCLHPAAGLSSRSRFYRDRKSTRLNSSTNAHLVCRLLLETKN